MGEYAVTLSAQTYRLLARLAESTQRTPEQVISDLAEQPSAYITKRPGVQGGDPCIRGTRIPVWVLAAMHKQGDTVEDILDGYPNLTAAQVHAAISYYYEHRAAIDAVIAVQNRNHIEVSRA